jgi:hypothetical protein
VNELPEPDRSLCLLKYGLGYWGEMSRAEAEWIVGVSDRHAQTALQRAGRKLRRDGRLRALKRLLDYTRRARTFATCRSAHRGFSRLLGPQLRRVR